MFITKTLIWNTEISFSVEGDNKYNDILYNKLLNKDLVPPTVIGWVYW